jgi:hypothetical protein
MRQIDLLLPRVFICAGLLSFSPSLLNAEQAAFHTTTDWQLKPSLKYDALCLMNALSGDPYYLRFYQAEYDRLHPQFTADENAAFQAVKRILKDEARTIVSAQLTLYYSAVPDETLPEMIRTAHDSSVMRTALRQTPYFSDNAWKTYEEVRPALETALRALNRVRFDEYWERTSKPRIEQRIAQLTQDLPKYNILPVIERHLGFALPSGTITVYVLAYSEPHDIRVTGLRFLTHRSYPFRVVLHSAIHESMHPPYDVHGPGVQKAIELLSKDPLVVDKVAHHDPSYGYNTASGYIEEDSVEALEQIVSEQFGAGRDPYRYWKHQDDGMHVLATAIYTGYKAALKRGPLVYSEWFVHAVEDGELRGERMRATVNTFSAKARYREAGLAVALLGLLTGVISAALAYRTSRNPLGWFVAGCALNVFGPALIVVANRRRRNDGSVRYRAIG